MGGVGGVGGWMGGRTELGVELVVENVLAGVQVHAQEGPLFMEEGVGGWVDGWMNGLGR